MSMIIYAKDLLGTVHTLEVSGRNTIEHVKGLVLERINKDVGLRDIRLIHAGRELEYGRMLVDYNIPNESTIHFVRKRICNCWHFDLATHPYSKKEKLSDCKKGKQRLSEVFGKSLLDVRKSPPSSEIYRYSWKRLVYEIVDLYEHEESYIVKHVVFFDPTKFPWTIVLRAPEDSVYQGANCTFLISVPREYPFRPVFIQPKTKLFHPWKTDSTLLEEGCRIFSKDTWSPGIFLRDMVGFLLDAMSRVFEISLEKKFHGESQAIKLMKKYGKKVFERVARIHTYCHILDEEEKKKRNFDVDLEERVNFVF